MAQRRYPPATVPPDHPAAKLPRRRLAVLRPGMVVEGVVTRFVRGGVLVDILLESGEPAFVPLAEIPAKAMPKVRELLERGTLQPVRIVQLDRASGTATASLQGLIETEKGRARGAPAARQDPGAPPYTRTPSAAGGPRRPPGPAPEPPPQPEKPAAAQAGRKTSASERARKQQEEILRRLRGG